MIAPAMAARAMGVRSLCKWEAFFQYAERHVDYEGSGSYGGEFGSNPTTSFHRQFYNEFKNEDPPTPVEPPDSEFDTGDRIKLSASVQVRSSGSSSASLLGSQSANATGTLIDGPVESGGAIWWRVNWDTGVDGWTVESDYVKLTGALPPLEDPPTITD